MVAAEVTSLEVFNMTISSDWQAASGSWCVLPYRLYLNQVSPPLACTHTYIVRTTVYIIVCMHMDVQSCTMVYHSTKYVTHGALAVT